MYSLELPHFGLSVTVVELLEGGADPSCEDEKKRTPLHFAASQGYETISKLFAS